MQDSPNNLVLESADVHFTDLIGGLFDEPPGYRVFRRYGASTWLLFMCLGGSGRVKTASTQMEMEPGTVFVLEPRLQHEYMTSPTAAHWEFAWVHFWPRPHWSPLLDWRVYSGGLRVLPAQVSSPRASKEQEMWQEMIDLTRRQGWLSQLEAMLKLEQILISFSSRLTQATGSRIDRRVEDAIAFMIENLAKPIGVADIAGACGLSTSRFTEVFREATGSAPRDYLERERLFRARHLLSSTRMSIKDVSRSSGFESEFYFSTRFKLLTGCSPTMYRQIKQSLAGCDTVGIPLDIAPELKPPTEPVGQTIRESDFR